MPDLLTVLLVVLGLSLIPPAWAYARAFRLHCQIEALVPGFNARMGRLLHRLGLHK